MGVPESNGTELGGRVLHVVVPAYGAGSQINRKGERAKEQHSTLAASLTVDVM